MHVTALSSILPFRRESLSTLLMFVAADEPSISFTVRAISLLFCRESLSMFLISMTRSGDGLLGLSSFPDAVAALEARDELALEEPFPSLGIGFPHQSVPLRSHSA